MQLINVVHNTLQNHYVGLPISYVSFSNSYVDLSVSHVGLST